MSLKLITFTRIFTTYIWQFKQNVIIAMFMVIEDDKLIKRSFSEINHYNDVVLSEIDALVAGMSWIVQNVKDVHKKHLDVVLCGAGRTRFKKDISEGKFLSDYGYIDVMKLVLKFDDVSYSVQGKIIDDNPIYDFYKYTTSIFEMYYGKEYGFTHEILQKIEDTNTLIIVGEPETHWKNGTPKQVWS